MINQKRECKDFWIDTDKSCNDKTVDSSNLKVPSFIRLFVIRRIIRNSIDYGTSTGTQIKNLVNVHFAKEDTAIVLQAYNILLRLVQDGLKTYMSKWYNETKDSTIIEMIFNKIILVKFEKEYNQLITFDNGNIYNHYQNLVFNTNDLMCKIFEYFEIDEDLSNCSYSFVNSHWLYHSWNINSIYFVELNSLIRQTMKHTQNDNNAALRMWQRYGIYSIPLKHMCFCFFLSYSN